MALGPWQIVIIAVLVVLLFGRGKISSLMGDVAKGITSFKKGLKEGEGETSTAHTEPTKPVADGRVIDGDGVEVEKKDKADA